VQILHKKIQYGIKKKLVCLINIYDIIGFIEQGLNKNLKNH
jgi:hypothetical protein